MSSNLASRPREESREKIRASTSGERGWKGRKNGRWDDGNVHRGPDRWGVGPRARYIVAEPLLKLLSVLLLSGNVGSRKWRFREIGRVAMVRAAENIYHAPRETCRL